jgi:hypothetical protein
LPQKANDGVGKRSRDNEVCLISVVVVVAAAAEDLVLDLVPPFSYSSISYWMCTARFAIAYLVGGGGSSGRGPGIGRDWSGLVVLLLIGVSCVEVVLADLASGLLAYGLKYTKAIMKTRPKMNKSPAPGFKSDVNLSNPRPGFSL